jgi:serine/threonine protein kinase
MYTFLTGKPPFDTDGIRNTLNKVVHAEYEMPSYLSPEAQDLISCLLKKKPPDRIPLNSKFFNFFLYYFHLIALINVFFTVFLIIYRGFRTSVYEQKAAITNPID